jgi:thioredoxin 1
MANEQSTNGALEITDANFAQMLQSDQPVLVDFWAAWCGPCRVLAPVIDELAQETAGQFVIGKLDVDQNAEISTKYGVRSIPTLIIFKNGQEVDRLLGGQHTKEVLRAKLAAHAD